MFSCNFSSIDSPQIYQRYSQATKFLHSNSDNLNIIEYIGKSKTSPVALKTHTSTMGPCFRPGQRKDHLWSVSQAREPESPIIYYLLHAPYFNRDEKVICTSFMACTRDGLRPTAPLLSHFLRSPFHKQNYNWKHIKTVFSIPSTYLSTTSITNRKSRKHATTDDSSV